jgi:hypothetical protein
MPFIQVCGELYSEFKFWLCYNAEAFPTVGHKGQLPLMIQIRGGHMTLSKYAPEEI